MQEAPMVRQGLAGLLGPRARMRTRMRLGAPGRECRRLTIQAKACRQPTPGRGNTMRQAGKEDATTRLLPHKGRGLSVGLGGSMRCMGEGSACAAEHAAYPSANSAPPNMGALTPVPPAPPQLPHRHLPPACTRGRPGSWAR